MIKLADILNELNVPTSEDAYPLTGPETSTNGNLMINKYRFTNRKGDDMTVAVNFDTRDEELYVVFYQTSEEETDDDTQKYGSKTGSGDMIKILATVVEAVNRTAEKLGGMEKVRRIHIEPADKKRFNIYMHYAQTLFPQFEVRKMGRWMLLINKNYKP